MSVETVPSAPEPRRARRRIGRWLLALIAIAAAPAGYVAYAEGTDALIERTRALASAAGQQAAALQKRLTAPPKPEVVKLDRPVLVQSVSFQPLTPERTFVGTVRARVESDLGFRVGGKVAERLVQAGDPVKAGQPLARLDDTDLRLQREQAEAELRSARASLAQAEAEERRQVTLRGEGWSTASAFDRQKAATEEARGRVARGERTLALAENALGYATLVATADGVVTAANVDPGQVVAAGMGAIRVAQASAREAVVAVPEALVERVRHGKASVTLWSEPGRSYPAALREFSPQADAATRTYQARFTILEAPGIDLGATATVTVRDAEGASVARLPLSALFSQGAAPSVWVVEPGTGALTLRPVQVLSYEARDVLVTGGLKDGEQVVTLGVQKLDAGQRVRVVAGAF